MNAQVPTFVGWYPDSDSGGSRFWDGSRWTGDVRPRRKSFAAAANDKDAAQTAGILGGMFSFGLIMLGWGGGSTGMMSAGVMVLLGFAAAIIYFLRGQGPTTAAVEKRLAEKRAEADKSAKQAAKLRRRRGPFIGVTVEAPDVVGAARVDAVANPETARALQNLQNLLYTRAISDAEYRAAKANLLGASSAADSFGHIAKLVELHQAGILSDFEFAAAKAKALGI